MKQTKMSAAQITIWFTNARVKMRKEKKLSLKSNGKKQKKEQQQDDFDDSISIVDEIFASNISPCKQFVLAYSSLNIEQIVCYPKTNCFRNSNIFF
jgi:hypothetical protein